MADLAGDVAAAREIQAQLSETLHRIDTAAAAAAEAEAVARGEKLQGVKSTIDGFSEKVDDLRANVEEMWSEINVERELAAAAKLKEEKEAILTDAKSAEARAEASYERAKARIAAEAALDKSLRDSRRTEEKLAAQARELALRREARVRADLLYSSDLARTIARLEDRELALDRARSSLTSAYEKRRLHDAVRRIRLTRLSLADDLTDYDHRGRRLAALLDYPTLLDGVSTRYYDTLAPYYYPYSSLSRASYYGRYGTYGRFPYGYYSSPYYPGLAL